MSDHSEVRRQIARLFAEQLSVEVPTDDTDLFDSGIVDSLKFVELLVQLEQKFGTKVNLNDLELDNFRSIDRIAQFVMQQSARKRRPQPDCDSVGLTEYTKASGH
jgi:methoxymalonate biosynthesis acyl carrier protein